VSNPKNLPPDDFSMTTPGIRMPKNDLPQEDSQDDWGKTNYNYSPKQSPAADDWGKAASSRNAPHNQSEDDFGKTQIPGQRKDVDYGATQANISLPRANYEQDDFGGRQSEKQGATMPYFQLPESERAKYQNLPPAAAKPQTEAEKRKEKGGIPAWVWAAGGLGLLFLFAVGVLLIAWFFIRSSDFELTVKGAPVGSDIFVDGQRWSLSSSEGTYKLPGLKAGEKKTIEIKRAGYTCQPEEIVGENGTPKELIAKCAQVAAPPKPNECANIKKGDFAKAAKCANDALDNLKEPFSVEDLLRAMNMYIINFPSGKFDIVKPEDKAFLQKAAGYIQKLPPNVIIEVGGHTDNVGNKTSNLTLSENRAKAVKTALVGIGVKDSVLQMKGYGDSKPKSSNDTDDGKFQNRRIEYSVAGK
jgi:outer membrane protein OmpA-like peptidoglycan-associated protein